MVSSLTPEGAEFTFEALRRGAVDFAGKPSRAISLSIEEMSTQLVEKVRNAASIKLRKTARLRERVRHRISAGLAPLPAARPFARLLTGAYGLVLVGTSTGGPPALEALLAPVAGEFPVAHSGCPAYAGGLYRLAGQPANRICQLTVQEVTAPTLLAPGHVYIGQGDADMGCGAQRRRAGGGLGQAAARLPLAPQRGPAGAQRDERDGGGTIGRRADDRDGQ